MREEEGPARAQVTWVLGSPEDAGDLYKLCYNTPGRLSRCPGIPGSHR